MKAFWSKIKKPLLFYWILCYSIALSGNSYLLGYNRQQWDLTAFGFIAVQSLVPSISNLIFVPLVIGHGFVFGPTKQPPPDEGPAT